MSRLLAFSLAAIVVPPSVFAYFTRKVQAIPIPNSSLIAKDGSLVYRDLFSVPCTIRIRPGTSRPDTTAVLDEIARRFFTAPTFRPERAVLGSVFTMDPMAAKTDRDIMDMKFRERDSALAWTVISRTDSEVLLQWPFPGSAGGKPWLSGVTYLAVDMDRMDKSGEKKGHEGGEVLSIQIRFGSGLRMPVGTVVTLFHQWYSKFLLAGLAMYASKVPLQSKSHI